MMEQSLSQVFDWPYYIVLALFAVCLITAFGCIYSFVRLVWNNFWE